MSKPQDAQLQDVMLNAFNARNSCSLGMCGNANADPKDDFVNRQSKNCAELPNSMKMWCVGNSWIFGKATGPLRYSVFPLQNSMETESISVSACACTSECRWSWCTHKRVDTYMYTYTYSYMHRTYIHT